MPKLSNHQKGILALIIANIIWGAASPIFKLSLENIPPFALAFFRFSFAAVLLFPFVYREFFDMTDEIRNWKEIIGFSLCAVTINITFFFLALQLTSAINSPIIGSSAPIMLLILSAVFLHEKLSKAKIIGAVLSLSGIILIIIQPILSSGMDSSVLGNVLLIGATLGAVGQTVLGRKLAHKYPPLALTFWAFLIGSLTFLPLAIPQIINLPPLDWRGILGIIFGVVFSSTIAYSLHTYGLSQIEASEAGIFFYLDPIFAILLAYPLLGEKPTPIYIIGAVLVFVGILITERRLNWHPVNQLFKVESK